MLELQQKHEATASRVIPGGKDDKCMSDTLTG
jgi:hypothetical protein